jgi:uncharacterized protein (UPF0210 family)
MEATTSVCSLGLDMVLVPGHVAAEALAGIIMDAAAIGIVNRKTTAVRVIPVPGKKVGEKVDRGGLFGSGTIANVSCPDGNSGFISRGGHIPAPIQSLTN